MGKRITESDVRGHKHGSAAILAVQAARTAREISVDTQQSIDLAWRIAEVLAATKKPAVRPARSHTYTFVVMEVSQSTYDEVHKKLLDAGYDHAIHKEVRDGTVLDMNGIALGLAT